MNEIRPIPDYPHYYCDISGNIYRYKDSRLVPLHPYCNKDYMVVKLYRDIVSVARIIATVFLPEDIPENAKVFHLDGQITNNAVDNLVWATPVEIRELTDTEVPLRRQKLEEMRNNERYYDYFFDSDDEEDENE